MEAMTKDETELSNTIKVRFTGKLRDRLDERLPQYAAEERANEEEKYASIAARAFDRQKTNLVIETVEEAETTIKHLKKYYGSGWRQITWCNASMASGAKRVAREIYKSAEEQNVELDTDW